METEIKEKMDIIIVYDFDGTLIDNMPLHVILAGDCINKYFGLPFEKAKEEYLRTTGVPFDDQLKIIFPESEKEETREKCAKEYHSRKGKEVYEGAENFPDTIITIKKITEKASKKGVNLWQIITSGSERNILKNWISENQLEVNFQKVFGKEDGLKKDHFPKIRQSYTNAQIFFIGDSPGDMKVASQAGLNIYRIGFLGNYGQLKNEEIEKKSKLFFEKGADKLINKLSELVSIIFNQ